jgi:hypothetical protein
VGQGPSKRVLETTPDPQPPVDDPWKYPVEVAQLHRSGFRPSRERLAGPGDGKLRPLGRGLNG